MDNELVCYTFDAALEMAISMEEEGFRTYLAAIRQLTHKGAKDLLRGNALDELNHKHQLEKALLEGRMSGGDDLDQPIQT
ncbi:MAG: ferritin family protein, partial [Desulfuromonadales bacterium]